MNCCSPLTSAAAFNTASNCDFLMTVQDRQTLLFAQNARERRGLPQAIGLGRVAHDKVGDLCGRQRIQDVHPLRVDRMNEAVVVLHPPAQICLADLDEPRLRSDLRRGRTVEREVDRVDARMGIAR